MRLTRSLRAIGWLVPLLLLSACGPAPSPSPIATARLTPSPAPLASVTPTGPLGVTLGIYSGRPDPEWPLTAEQAAALTALLDGLPPGVESPPTGGLGYHGFTIRYSVSTLVVYQGFVAPPGVGPGAGPRAVRLDPTRSVERYLLETGRAYLAANEILEVERALAGS